MSFTFGSFQSLLVPLVLIFAFIGYTRRGFWGEIGITGGMALVILATILFPQVFIGFINRILINIPRVFGLLLGVNAQPLDENLLFGDPSSGRYLLARIALFVLLSFLVYTSRFAWAFDGGKPRLPKTTFQKLLGGVFGGVTGFLWFVAINNFLNEIRALRNDPTLPLENTTITVPTVGDIGPLLAFVPTIVVVLLVILLILAALRLPNLWKG